ncbi:MAG: hypothetical protein WCC90_21885, partial [Methylocella sp.]
VGLDCNSALASEVAHGRSAPLCSWFHRRRRFLLASLLALRALGRRFLFAQRIPLSAREVHIAIVKRAGAILEASPPTILRP